ncbi:PrsW family intramembrane metalloprotease [Burkholderia stagnalis]
MEKDSRRMFYWSLLVVLTWLASMAWVWARIGTTGMGWGFPLSVLVTLPVTATFLWLGRWCQGRETLLLSAFAWGASVAGFFSIWSQEGLQAFVDAHVGIEFGKWFRPLVITPVTEELSKGIFLVWMLLYRRTQIRGLLDGIIYGGLVGAGFAFSEQTMYFGQVVVSYLDSAPADSHAGVTLAMSFLLRGLMVPFMHPFFVVFVGMGVAVAAGTRNRAVQGIAVLAGFLFPIGLHGLWDWTALAGRDPFMIYKIYAAVMMPLFAALAVLALILRRRRSVAIIAALPGLAREGHIARHEMVLLASLKERRGWRNDARQRGGWAAARSTGRYQAEASALAILTARAPGTEGHERVEEQVRAVESARSDMVARLFIST